MAEPDTYAARTSYRGGALWKLIIMIVKETELAISACFNDELKMYTCANRLLYFKFWGRSYELWIVLSIPDRVFSTDTERHKKPNGTKDVNLIAKGRKLLELSNRGSSSFKHA